MAFESLLTLAGRYRRAGIAAAVLAVATYLALLILQAQTKKPWPDEAALARAGFNLADKGHTGVEFFDEKTAGFPGVKHHTYYVFPLQLPVFAVWYKLVGFSLFTTRLLSIVWTFCLLAAWFYVLWKLTGEPGVALLATGFTAADYHMMTGASFGRYDMMVAALGYSGYTAYLYFREKNLPLALAAANTCIAASGATQPNGVFYFLGLWLMVLYLDRKRLGWKSLAVAAIPYAVGGVIWGAYIMEDLPSFLGQMKRNSGSRFGLLHPVATLLAEIELRYITPFGLGAHSVGHESPWVRLKAIPLAAYLLGALGCLLTPSLRRNPAYRLLFLLTGTHWFLMTFYDNMKYSLYLVHLIPFYAALLSIWLASLWRARRVPAALLAAAAVGVIAVQIGGVAMKIRINDHAMVYTPAVEFLKSYAKPGEQVAASSSWGFSYGFDTGFVDDESFGYTSGNKPEFIVLEEIYDEQHKLFKTYDPPKYNYIQGVLASYRVIYRGGNYRIYEKPGRLAAAE